jgi:integrase
MALTTKKVAGLTEAGRYGDGHGLYLQVISPANRSWILRYERRGRERWMGLGALHTFSLAEARERARKARQQLADGIDPLDARKAESARQALATAKTATFEDCARQFFITHEAKWRNAKHRAQFFSTLADCAFPVFGALPVGAIDTGLVLKVVEPIWLTKTETANRVRGRIEAVLDWATVRGYRTGDNPARWKGHLAEVLPARGQIAKVQHHRALPYADLPEFVATLATRGGIAARALEFTILTAARTSEVIGARWSEIDLQMHRVDRRA